ncbi:hypothetical protein HPB47_016116 [Ixodes persulcatus]|uniref:Uncharacterized protein n=1 Tax=Ixodes persulcatus TaxID=34615 RepID=A0AC60QRR0_IXOPE|nr:hypothetical protein HPB47_016116 [Ixodes persulcatus]
MFQCDVPESHQSNFEIGLKPRLPSLGKPQDLSMALGPGRLHGLSKASRFTRHHTAARGHDFPALEVNEDSPAELGLAGNTGFAFPPPLLLLSHSNPFAPLATLENAQQSEGKSDDLLTASCIVSTAPEGQKRARSTVQASTASKRSTQARTSARSVQTTSSRGMYGKDSSHDEDGYTLVTYSRKKRYPLMAATPPTSTQPPAPRLSRLTSTRLPYRIGLRSFTVRVLPYKPKVAVCTTCHRMGHVKERCPNTDNARCSICGLKKHDGDASCPNATPKCRNCGGPHLATDKGCLKRTQLNKKIARRRRPKAPRRIETTVDNQGQPLHAGKRTGASSNNTDTTTPLVPGSAGDPRRVRLIATPTSTSFYTGPRTSAQETTATAAERKLTFADAVRMANADTATQTINTTQRRGSKLAQESQTPRIQEPAAQVSEETQTETAVRISASTTPSTQITLEALLERRIAQLEQRVMEHVQKTIDRAIETCVRTLMERLMLSSTSPFGASITQPAPAASMVTSSTAINGQHGPALQ